MYELHMCISWMSEHVILLPIYINVNIFVIGECEKPCRLEKTRVIKRSFMSQLVFIFNAYLICIKIPYLIA